MTNEWFYIPNIIGYIRVVLLALFFIIEDPLSKVILMSINLVLDVFDGKIARKLNQTSLFGARFDLIIDMVSLVLLSFYVAALSKNFLFVLCGINDGISYALSILIFYGKKQQMNHKSEIGKKGLLLPIYYSAWGLALSNVLHDAYLLKFVYWPAALGFVVPICLGGYLFRQLCVAEQTVRLLRKIRAMQSSL
ncbi:MAG: CDP-alcohol phosphatidyltransferase family protein [Verrucomicrobia bacterium]|nr:CDP-alcohol phosphatidyltransferase family protein [Verrucomicrobiota bacterium]